MTVKECYARLGGDYSEFLARVGTDEKVIKFLKLFMADETYKSLCAAIESDNIKAAFVAAHTLKGLTLNLAFTDLAKKSSDITELLRPGLKCDEIYPAFERLQSSYNNTASAIQALLSN